MGFFDRFLGKKTLTGVEAVELTSLDIFTNAMAQVRSLINDRLLVNVFGTNPNHFNETANSLVIELTVFSLHLADRISFNILGAERRSVFMNQLITSVTSNLSRSMLRDASPENLSEHQSAVSQLYWHRSQALEGFDISSEGALPGTLFWEAGNLAASDLFEAEDLPGAVLLLPILFGQCIQGLQNLRKRLELVSDF